ncbi:hypothetical protein CKA32_002677 [Geitlerinema sp. FC II]|nr:hypothetical protein CKA32_006523 [Geitlerinema sp. FC II]PPT06486.1 hypothetical protein CKA32_001679 [Geitlerinema sp. FC II]PPT08813.1 hypothetical protein CKA32_002677 [Geitlerinema sp. FC II]
MFVSALSPSLAIALFRGCTETHRRFTTNQAYWLWLERCDESW